MTTRKTIPIRTCTPDDIDALHERLADDGYMRMMQIGEPRLSELVTKYKGKGYEVEVVPFVDDGDDGSSPLTGGGCGPGSCSSAGTSGSGAGGCGSGSCGSESAQANGPAASPPTRRAGPRTVIPGVGTIYIRMKSTQVAG